MSRSEFLKLMRFPSAWLDLGMYPNSLFAMQLASYTPGAEAAPEHFRFGAFLWWLSQQPTEHQLVSLATLSRIDPDALMATDAQQRIRQSPGFSPQVEAALRART